MTASGMLDDKRTDGSYTALQLDALSCAQTSNNLGVALNGTATLSLDAWIRFNGLPAQTYALAQNDVFAFGTIGSSVFLQFNGFPLVISDPGQAHLQDDAWHHICATFDGFNVRLYIDGVFNSGQLVSGTGNSNANPVQIGVGLQGLVRRVRVYNQALTATAVLNNMFGAVDPLTLTASFDFTLNPPVDKGPQALPISMIGNALMIKVTPGLVLEGTGFARPFGDRKINPGGAQVDPYTIQGWVYVNSLNNSQQTIFINSDLDSDTGIALYLQLNAENRGFNLVSQRGSNGPAGQQLVSQAIVPLGSWVNVATSFDGNMLKLYIQGQFDSSKSCSPIPLQRNASDLLIGAALARGIPAGATNLLGYLPEVDVWSRALSTAEILSYTSSLPNATATGLVAAYNFTTSPPRNQVNGHPIGLAEGAVLGGQLQAAPVGGFADEDVHFPESESDAAMLSQWRASIDYGAVLALHREKFHDCARADAAAFSEPHEQEHIRTAWQDILQSMQNAPLDLPFQVTRHDYLGEKLLVCHTPQGSYVGFRAKADTTDDCTLWRINLLFIVVGGGLAAITGVGARLSDGATIFMETILTNPRIAAQMARGQAMNARGVFGLLAVIATMGFLRPLVIMLLDVGFWTLIRVVARLILIALGVGSVNVIASLVATAATFAVAYVGRPSSCDPMPIINLGGITFDYDPTRVATVALSIRRNFGNDVDLPEWRKGMTLARLSPVAYAITAVSGKIPTVKLNLDISAMTAQNIQVRAAGGGVLGAIDAVSVDFSVNSSVSIVVPLTHHTLTANGIQMQDVSWVWQYRIGNSDWQNLATSNHRVYILLSPPNSPWAQAPDRSESQLPWTDVLDYACVWAAGATTSNVALTAITTKVNSGLGLTYDMSAGASVYTGRDRSVDLYVFYCGKFVDFLGGGVGLGKTVNCADCATILATFANILGCNGFASRMKNKNSDAAFVCNQILAIGQSAWAQPFRGTGFYFHEVLWLGAGSYPDILFDACLQYDVGNNPWGSANHSAGLPLQIPFTNQLPAPSLPLVPPFTGSSYRERLCANTAAGIGSCQPVGPLFESNSGRRPVR